MKSSSGENHYVAALEPKKVKIKDVSYGENPTMAPKEERLDTLPKHEEERSSILIEPIRKVNIGTELDPKFIHLATSLTPLERKDFIKFFQEQQVNFSWSYANMPELDLEFIMHHLNVKPRVKPVKKS